MEKRNREAKPKRNKIPAFVIPSEERFAEIGANLRIDKSQISNLRLALQQICADIEDYRLQASVKEREHLLRRLQRIAKLLNNVRDEIGRAKSDMPYFMPSKSFEALGSITSPAAVQKLLKEKCEIEAESSKAPRETINFERSLALYHRDASAFGIKYGPDLMSHIFDAICNPMDQWLELNAMNKGGRPTDLLRIITICGLAEWSEDIIGHSASATEGSTFIGLCEQVFIACGLPHQSTEKAVARTLKIWKSSKRGKAYAQVKRDGLPQN